MEELDRKRVGNGRGDVSQAMIKDFAWVKLARKYIPRDLRFFIQRYVSLRSLKLRWRETNNPLADKVESDEDRVGLGMRMGIIRNAAHYHSFFVRACMEIGVPFRVIDLYGADWLNNVARADCRILLVWPDGFMDTWNSMIKDRVKMLESVLGYPTVPSSDELWMYEDKRRTAYWLEAHQIPHPRTWIFYDRDEAMGFADRCDLPIVFKTSFGAAASGVRILSSRRQIRRLIATAFSRGIAPGGTDWRDRTWGNIIFQEYLADVKEWRMVRIGDAFFGHPKGRVGQYHSGSGSVLWDVPGKKHLDLLKTITDLGGFRSMNVDVFETPDGRLFVNELQAVFGASYSVDQLRVNGQPGRFLFDRGEWRFDPGEFARNACANARVLDAIERFGTKKQPL